MLSSHASHMQATVAWNAVPISWVLNQGDFLLNGDWHWWHHTLTDGMRLVLRESYLCCLQQVSTPSEATEIKLSGEKYAKISDSGNKF